MRALKISQSVVMAAILLVGTAMSGVADELYADSGTVVDQHVEELASTGLEGGGSPASLLTDHPVMAVMLLLFMLCVTLAFRFSDTPYGILHPLAALSLKLTSFELSYKPDQDVDFRLPISFNLLFLLFPILPKERVSKTRDIMIPGEQTQIPVRVYWPKSMQSGAAPLPVMVFFHGGGFVLGNVAIYDSLTRALANATSTIVVSVDYRLAPRYTYPAAVDDCYEALKWVAANVGIFGGDAARLIVAGDSAGGNLATVTAIRARDESGPEIAGQILYYPVADWTTEDYDSIRNFGEGFGLSMAEMHGFRQAYIGHLEDYSDPYISPLCAPTLESLPPAMVITAGFDLLTGAAEAYVRRLEVEGVKTTLLNYPSMIHGFMNIVFFGERRDALNKTREFVESLD